jgi:ribonuclease HI
MVGMYGPFWESLAEDRNEWRRAKCEYLQSVGVVPTLVGDFWEAKFLRHITNKQSVYLKGKRMVVPRELLIISDSEYLVKAVAGEVRAPSDPHIRYLLKSLRWGLYAFEYQWKFRALQSQKEILQHKPRSVNSLADGFCNLVLDQGVPKVELILAEVPVQPHTCIVLSFDGASRGNPGPSSCAALVQLYSGGQMTLAAYRACALGVTTNTVAEFEAASLAQGLLTDWCLAAQICVQSEW